MDCNIKIASYIETINATTSIIAYLESACRFTIDAMNMCWSNVFWWIYMSNYQFGRHDYVINSKPD